MNKLINVRIKDKIATLTNDVVYVCGNSDYVVEFDFDSEWLEHQFKTARFIYGNEYTDVVFEGTQCSVPKILDAYDIAVGVYAGDLRTTTAAHIGARRSILSGSDTPASPAPDVFEQMVELFNAGLDESRVNANAAEAAKEAAERSASEADASKIKAAESERMASVYSGDAQGYMMTTKTHAEAAEMMAGTANGYANLAGSFADNAAQSEANAKASELTALQAMDTLLMVDTANGKIATTENAANMPIRKLTLNGTVDVQAVKCIGKNFFHRDYNTAVTNIGVTVEWDAENQEFILNGTTTAGGDIKIVNPLKIDWVPDEQYTVSVRKVGGTATLAAGTAVTTYAWSIFQDNAAKYIRGQAGNSAFLDVYSFTNKAFALDAKRQYIFYFQCWRPGTVFDNYRVKIQVEQGRKVTDWEPYREESVAFADATTLKLHKGNNNVMCVPQADISMEYAVDTKMYIDSKFAELQAAALSMGGNV